MNRWRLSAQQETESPCLRSYTQTEIKCCLYVKHVSWGEAQSKKEKNQTKPVFYTICSNSLIQTKTWAGLQRLAGLLPLTPERLDYKSCPAVEGQGFVLAPGVRGFSSWLPDTIALDLKQGRGSIGPWSMVEQSSSFIATRTPKETG